MPIEASTIKKNIERMLADSIEGLSGKMVDDHVVLDITEPDVHYWSPQLNFRVEPSEEQPDRSVVSGLIGPRPEVWTMFMFIYFSIGIIGFFISSYGVAQWMMGAYSHYLLAFPIAALLMLTAYKAGKYGESLASDQIEILKQFVRDAITLDTTI